MLLAVLNYAHFNKICRSHAFTLYFKFGKNICISITMQQTCKWQTHLPYLRLETLRVHNSFSENYKNSNKKQLAWTPSWVTELVRYALSSVGPRFHECDSKQEKKIIL